MEIILEQARVGVADAPGQPGVKLLKAIDPSGIAVTLPLDQNACRVIAAALTSGIVVANGPLPKPSNGKPV